MKHFLGVISLCSLLSTGCSADSSSGAPAVTRKSVTVKHRAEKSETVSTSLVTIESTYKDLASPAKDVTVKGSGFLVLADNKSYVVTASHVSQGQNLRIQRNGQDIAIKGRYYVDTRDLEIIEVEGITDDFDFVLNGQVIEWLGQDIQHARWVDAFNFALLNDWVQDPNLALDNIFAKQESSAIFCDMSCQLLESTSLMQPGSSGSPLVTKIPLASEWTESRLIYDARELVATTAQDRYFLRGLTIRRDRFFARSAFVPAGAITEAIAAYKQGTRTSQRPKAVWNVSSGLIFRIYNEYLYESAAVSGSSGNGISMDGGNVGDLNEENPKEVLSKITAVPVDQGEPRSYWLMMMRHPKTSQLLTAPVWFDMEHYMSLARFTMGLSPSNPADKDKYLNIFISRFGGRPKPTEMLSADGAGKITFPAKGFMQVDTTTAEGVQLSFLLNEFGAYCTSQTDCTEKFQAIIEVPANNGQVYFVDLRGFLFVNPVFAKTNAFYDSKVYKMTPEEWQTYYFDEFQAELQKVRLSFRKKRAVQTPLSVQDGQVTEQVWEIK
jgi:hypothetical protein